MITIYYEVKIYSIKTIPFKTVLKGIFKKSDWHNYNIKVLDKNNLKEAFVYVEYIGDSDSIRFIIEKEIFKELPNQKGTYEEVGIDIIFDKLIAYKYKSYLII